MATKIVRKMAIGNGWYVPELDYNAVVAELAAMTADRDIWRKVANVYAAQLRDAGIALGMPSQETPAAWTCVCGAEHLRRGARCLCGGVHENSRADRWLTRVSTQPTSGDVK